MNTRKHMRYFLGIAVLVIALSGCAETGPILLHIGYLQPEERPVAATRVAAGVSPLRDSRGKPASVLGKRTIPSGLQNDLVVQGTVSELVAAALKDALKARGISVKDVSSWDLTAEGMRAQGTNIVLGGEIKTLWLESTGTTLNTNLKASVKIKIVAGDPAAKKIVRTIDVSSNFEQDVLYSQSKLESALSEALSGAIDQIFNDDTLKKKLL